MRNYELTLIFSPLLSEQEANDLFQKFVSFVQEQGGILGDQRMLGKRPLLAPIGDSKEGYLATVSYSLSEEKLPALQEKCAAEANLLRFLLTKQPKKTKVRAVPMPTPAPAQDGEQRKEEKVDLADIDQKLEEIFKE